MAGINMYSNCCCAPPVENSGDVCSECKEHADFINEGEVEVWIEFAPDAHCRGRMGIDGISPT